MIRVEVGDGSAEVAFVVEKEKEGRRIWGCQDFYLT